ncbi:MAG: hypothetical protein OQK24_02145, partial [Magnetovibrio sp.]|nr:hypothetical protein [Magnetovibrio sp.]
MKIPLINKLSGLGSAFARLNPVGLISKIKSLKKGSGDDEDENRNFHPSGSNDDDLFEGLGDLDQIEAEAAERTEKGATSADDDDEFGDTFDSDSMDDEPDVLDEFDQDDETDFADLDSDEAQDLDSETIGKEAPDIP